MLTIWGRENSTNVQKVIWLCDELGLGFDRVDMGGPFGGLDDPAYRRLNPNGLVPTIDHDGFVLWESHAILRYLASADSDRRFYPADIRQAATIDKWMDWQVISLAWQLRTLVMANRPGAETAGEGTTAATAKIKSSLALLDRHLEETPFIGGKQF
ncbi:MAG TPA: glutathione S-transferase N-terminal domain-containing protein, partial [Magnetospirillaceae bacterium]|nr:glutathione S-transferase N-terminal domain-containing protein [Magnetospirillaceae bacterium]